MIRLTLQLIMLKCIPSQSDHLGMMINGRVKYLSHRTSYWAAAVMWVAVTPSVIAARTPRKKKKQERSSRESVRPLIFLVIFFFFFVFFCLRSSLKSQLQLSGSASPGNLHTRKCRCKVVRTSGAPCGHTGRRAR